MITPAGIICLGEALIDLTPPPEATLLNATSLNAMPGGAPLNVAVHLKRLGHRPLFAGTLSSDGFGERLRALMEQEGIPGMPEEPVDAPTRLAVIDGRDGRPPFRFYGDRPADTCLSTDHLDEAFSRGAEAIYAGSLMMIDENARETQRTALQRARAAGMLVACDPNPRPSAWPTQYTMVAVVEELLGYASLAKLSLDDARILDWPDQPDQLLERVCTIGAPTLVITDGPRGCWVSRPDGGLDHYAVPEVEVVDATGSGDAFFAAVIAGMLEHGTITGDAVLRACALGATVAGRHGAF